MPPKMKLPKSTKSKTIEIFTKLLAIKIVASSFLGLPNSLAMIFPTGDFPSFAALISVGESEKRATSEPEIIAEQHKRMKNTTNCTTIEKLGTSNCKANQFTFARDVKNRVRGGSESKLL